MLLYQAYQRGQSSNKGYYNIIKLQLEHYAALQFK